MSHPAGYAPGRRARLRAAVATLAVGAVALTGCSGGGSKGGKEDGGGKAQIAISPAADAKGVRPDAKVTVRVTGGTVREVKVTDKSGEALTGALSGDKTTWTASETLVPNARYTVNATAADSHDHTVTSTASFATLVLPRSKQLKPSSISPLDGSTVGVAQPLVVGFNRPVRDREAVQKALSVDMTPKVTGAWYWIDESHVHFRPQTFWAAGTKITIHANVAGVNAGGGAWGAQNRTIHVTIGRAQIIRVDVKKLKMRVERDGKVLKTFPVTSGKKGWETRNGTKVIMEKVTNKHWTNTAIDAPEHYSLYSAHAMRMTNSGEFIHDAPWNTGNIGEANTSHGCVGMTVSDMAWLYDHTLVGDAVVVTGSPKPFNEIDNRYQDWNVSWSRWLTGNYDLSDG